MNEFINKLFCPTCDQEQEFFVTEECFDYEVKDMTFEIKGKRAFCKRCKDELFHADYDIENQENAFRLYRLNKDILQPEEIIAIRKRYGLTQKDFSKLLGFGEITITRYENGSIPTNAQNQIIKSSSEADKMLEFFYQNKEKISSFEQSRVEMLLLNICGKKEGKNEVIEKIKPVFDHEPNVLSGYRKFDFDKFKEVVLFFTAKQTPYKTKLNKLMYYADHYFYKTYQLSITGSRYIRHYYGPVPERFQTLYESIDFVECIENEFGDQLRSLVDFKNIYLNKDELQTLEKVNIKFKTMTAREIAEYSHREKGWMETPQSKFIEYHYAQYIDID